MRVSILCVLCVLVRFVRLRVSVLALLVCHVVCVCIYIIRSSYISMILVLVLACVRVRALCDHLVYV